MALFGQKKGLGASPHPAIGIPSARGWGIIPVPLGVRYPPAGALRAAAPCPGAKRVPAPASAFPQPDQDSPRIQAERGRVSRHAPARNCSPWLAAAAIWLENKRPNGFSITTCVRQPGEKGGDTQKCQGEGWRLARWDVREGREMWLQQHPVCCGMLLRMRPPPVAHPREALRLSRISPS